VYPGDLIEYPFPPILVNIGDMLSYWTNGLLRSTVHRVVFPHEMPEISESKPRDRYSIAFFCQPVGSTELVPVPSRLVENHREKGNKNSNKSFVVGYGGGANSLDSDQPRMTASEHLQLRLNATYLNNSI
jgi:isopenicillin N synthase-like dioxygenase